MKRKLANKSGIPQYAIEQFARAILPDIRAYYESEEGQRRFAEWKEKQAKKKAAENSAAFVIGMLVLGNKQIIRTRLPLGRYGSDYIALVRRKGLEPPTLGTGIRCSIH